MLTVCSQSQVNQCSKEMALATKFSDGLWLFHWTLIDTAPTKGSNSSHKTDSTSFTCNDSIYQLDFQFREVKPTKQQNNRCVTVIKLALKRTGQNIVGAGKWLENQMQN